MNWSYIISPRVLDFLQDKVRAHGPGLAGCLFGTGWCLWLDAILINGMHNSHIPFIEYLPGIVATLAMILMCLIKRSSLSAYDSFDSAAFCRQRFWLFVAYVVSFASVIGASIMLLKHMAADSGHAEPFIKWTGWVCLQLAAVLQVTFILGSGLTLFASRGSADGDDGFYTAF